MLSASLRRLPGSGANATLRLRGQPAPDPVGIATLVFTCAACGQVAQANPQLVMSIPARWDGRQYVADSAPRRQPLCEQCARQLLSRFEREGLPVPEVVRDPDYFERAYHQGADEHDL